MRGNRTGEVYSGNTTAPLSMPVNWVNYDGNNRMTNSSQVMGGYTYDAAGDVTFDGANTYTYDAEGRVSTACVGQMCIKYIYDAEGRRVAKGSYDPQSGAFTATEQYILGLGGEEVTALNGDGQWLRTNAYLGGALLATYKDAALYFQFTDWLGTKRVQLANDGLPPEICRSLPYGNQLDCSGGEVDPHHFTGKQRDPETGLDYFGARYLSSNIGRWMSPDWSATATSVPYADFGDPQTLNLYVYVRNNPMDKADADGHCFEDGCVIEGGIVLGAMALYHFTSSPQGQRMIRNGIAAGAQMFNAAAKNTASFFSKKDSTAPQSNPAPGTQTGAQPGTQPKDVYVDPNKYPASAGHIADAQAAGHPDVLTVDRPGAAGRRTDALSGQPTQAGTDRDEYPPAVTTQGGTGASVRPIPASDNRGSGASIGQQIRDVPNGGQIRIVPKPKPEGN